MLTLRLAIQVLQSQRYTSISITLDCAIECDIRTLMHRIASLGVITLPKLFFLFLFLYGRYSKGKYNWRTTMMLHRLLRHYSTSSVIIFHRHTFSSISFGESLWIFKHNIIFELFTERCCVEKGACHIIILSIIITEIGRHIGSEIELMR